jgi:hypothetical protein
MASLDQLPTRAWAHAMGKLRERLRARSGAAGIEIPTRISQDQFRSAPFKLPQNF